MTNEERDAAMFVAANCEKDQLRLKVEQLTAENKQLVVNNHYLQMLVSGRRDDDLEDLADEPGDDTRYDVGQNATSDGGVGKDEGCQELYDSEEVVGVTGRLYENGGGTFGSGGVHWVTADTHRQVNKNHSNQDLQNLKNDKYLTTPFLPDLLPIFLQLATKYTNSELEYQDTLENIWQQAALIWNTGVTCLETK